MDCKRASANVVGDTAQAASIVGFRFVVQAAHFGRSLHDRHQDIDVIVGGDVLKNAGCSFHPHPCIDVFAWQGAKIVRWFADSIELREHQVPDFDRLAGI